MPLSHISVFAMKKFGTELECRNDGLPLKPVNQLSHTHHVTRLLVVITLILVNPTTFTHTYNQIS